MKKLLILACMYGFIFTGVGCNPTPASNKTNPTSGATTNHGDKKTEKEKEDKATPPTEAKAEKTPATETKPTEAHGGPDTKK